MATYFYDGKTWRQVDDTQNYGGESIIASNGEYSPGSSTEVKQITWVNGGHSQGSSSSGYVEVKQIISPNGEYSLGSSTKVKRKWHRLCCWVLILGCITFFLFGGILTTILKNNEQLLEEINSNKAEVSALTRKSNNTKYEISALFTEVNKTNVKVSTVFTENNTIVELSSLYKKLNDTKDKLSSILMEQNNTQVDVSELFAEVDSTKVKVSELFTEINNIKVEISALKDHLNLNTTQSCKCISSCINIPDGHYQSCSTCNGYISCVNQMKIQRSCPQSSPPLQWDDESKQCQHTSTTCC